VRLHRVHCAAPLDREGEHPGQKKRELFAPVYGIRAYAYRARRSEPRERESDGACAFLRKMRTNSAHDTRAVSSSVAMAPKLAPGMNPLGSDDEEEESSGSDRSAPPARPSAPAKAEVDYQALQRAGYKGCVLSLEACVVCRALAGALPLLADALSSSLQRPQRAIHPRGARGGPAGQLELVAGEAGSRRRSA